MRNARSGQLLVGGVAFLVVLTGFPSAAPHAQTPDAERGGQPYPDNAKTRDGIRDGTSHFTGNSFISDELCSPDFDLFSGEANSAPQSGHESGADRQLCDGDWTPPPFQDEQPAIAVQTRVRPGSPLQQTADITNTGNTPLFGIVTAIDIGSCTRGIGLLEPGRTTTASCTGRAPDDGRATAQAFGTSPLGTTVSDQDAVEVAPAPPPHPEVALDIGTPGPVGGNGSTEVPVRITNPSPVALHHVDVTGVPRECGRSFDRIDAGRSVTYDCLARPGDAVDLTVAARAEGGFLPEGAVVTAGSHVVIPPPPPPSPGGAPVPPAPASPPEQPVPPPAPEPPERTDASESQQGPRSSPAQTAAVISVVAMLVMTVSVGALSSATRPGK